jgi:hypothetical protein
VSGVIRGRVFSHLQRAEATWVLVGVFVLALANRLLPVLRGGGFSSVLGYDDAVYYAGAVGLVYGRMPYRDFLLLHPPGILLALAPAAAVGRWVGEVAGWEVSRIAWMLIGCCTSVLVARILLRFGKLAALLGGGVYAVFPGAVLVERTTLLEGLTNFCLASALALLVPRLVSGSPQRDLGRAGHLVVPLAAGILLGLATTVKIWSVVPLIVVCVFGAIVVGAQFGIVTLLAAAGTIGAVCLPFFLAAPSDMWRMVILDQVGRDRGAGVLERLAEIATMGQPPSGSLGVVVAIAAVLGLVVACLQLWMIERLRVAVPILVCTVLLLVASPAFFPHYLAILGVPVALAAGAMAVGVRPVFFIRRAGRLGAGVIGCVVLVVDVVALTRIESGEVVPASALNAAVLPAPGCITADDPNTLLALGVVGRNIERRCELMVDLGGYSHHLSRNTTLTRSRNREWQRVILDYLQSGHYALPTRFGRGRGLSRSTAAEIESWPVRLELDGYQLRQPS